MYCIYRIYLYFYLYSVKNFLRPRRSFVVVASNIEDLVSCFFFYFFDDEYTLHQVRNFMQISENKSDIFNSVFFLPSKQRIYLRSDLYSEKESKQGEKSV